MNDLYTVILDYQDGTYISQVREDSPEQACITWLKQLDLNMIGVIHDTHEHLLSEMISLEDKPVPLTGIKNVWCISFSFDDKFALVNIVKTHDR